MTINITAVAHDLKTNTIEVTWRDSETNVLVRSHNYSPSQRDMIVDDAADAITPYLTAANWTPEFCADFKAKEEAEAVTVAARNEAEAAAKKQAEFDAAVEQQAAILRAAQAKVASEAATLVPDAEARN